MTREKGFISCLMALGCLGLLGPGIAMAQNQGFAPQAAPVVGQVPAVGVIAAQPMYYYPVPMVGALSAPGYVYLPRRAYRHPRFYVAPAAVYQLEVTGPPGIAPSWSTMRTGLDRFPLLGGVEVGPGMAPAVPDGDASLMQPAPDPIGSQPSADVPPPPAPAPDLRAPMNNVPTDSQ